MPQGDQHQQFLQQSSEKNAAGIGRRTFLAASAATVLAGSRASFAQNQSADASAPTSEAAIPDAVKVERLDGSILLIRIDRAQSNRIEFSAFVGLGRALFTRSR